MRYKKKIIFFLLILFLLLFVIFILLKNDVIENMYYNVLKQFYGEPFSENGMINNSFFGINSDGTSATSTTKGINKAIEYASEHNIEYIKLEKGTYLIDGKSKSNYVGESTAKKGIVMQSNIIFDCNGSTLKHIDCDVVNYAVFSVTDVQNVTIMNGILIGDKESHNYSNVQSSHEWGFGIDVRGSHDVTLNNLNISNFTGDGIILNDIIKNEKYIVSKNIKISNCNIYACRRQGISVIDADIVDIYNNEIHDIQGTLPKTAIDLETNDDSNQKIKNIKIYNNKFYNLGSTTAILANRQVFDVEIYNNEINGNILLNDIREYAKIFENKINGNIIADTTTTKWFDAFINKIKIKNNEINASVIEIGDTKICTILENKIDVEEIKTFSSNLMLTNNNLISKTKCIYNIRNLDTQIYNIYSIQDNIEEINLQQDFIKVYKTAEGGNV